MRTDTTAFSKQLCERAAVLMLLLGLLTGVGVSGAMTGKLPADPHMAMAAHLNGLLGCFWMVAIAVTLPHLGYGPVGLGRLVLGATVANASNWLITLVKAWLKVSGVDFVGEARNDTIFGLLTTLVVLPSLAVAAAWVYGFRARAA